MAVVRVKRKCDEFDLNSRGMMVTHKCPFCDKRMKCTMHQSGNVEAFKHVCDNCGGEWLQYRDEDILFNRKVEEDQKEPYLQNEKFELCLKCDCQYEDGTKHVCSHKEKQ